MAIPTGLDTARLERELCPDPVALDRLRSLGGAGLLQKMIGLFLEHTPKRLRAATEGEKSGDWYQVERAAHSLKSSAGHLGLTGIQSLARDVEGLAERGQSAGLAALIRQIECLFQAAQTYLQDGETVTHD